MGHIQIEIKVTSLELSNTLPKKLSKVSPSVGGTLSLVMVSIDG